MKTDSTMLLWRLKCVATWRSAAFLMLVVAIASMSHSYYTYQATRLPFQLPSVRSEECIFNRRELARRVMRAQRQVEKLTGGGGGVGQGKGKKVPSLPQELRAIARELDPRITAITTTPAPHKNSSWVCPEEYHEGADTTLYRNFVQLKCDYAPPFREVVTVLLSTKGWGEERVRRVFLNIRKYYDVKVVVLTYGSSGSVDTSGMEGVSVEAFSAHTLASYAINMAVAKVKTPFVLVADSLTHFTGELCSLERLVRVLDQEGKVAAAAGGSYRTPDGNWSHGCLQRRIENYQLAYLSGYEHSNHDCMYCDDILGPLVARTSVLLNVTLNEDLEGPSMLRDWFINLSLASNHALVCPDVMFFVEEAPSMQRQAWLEVASKWAVQRVWPHDGHKLEFSCEELKIECVNIMKLVSSFLVPPCCREALRRELGYVQECAEELGLYVELQAGSLLGAVKTDGILPWDFDMDVLGDCKEQEVWMEKGTNCLSRKGCRSVHIEGNYWESVCTVSFIDISCRPDRLKYLPAEYHSMPTRVNYSGRMFTVPPNPALLSRNAYGPEYLRHQAHWRYTGKDKSQWNNCLAPGFHACLDHFPTDGNIRFKDFAHQLEGL